MTGPEHFSQAERLLADAEAMLAQDVAAADLAELLERQRLAVDMATAHATLAAAAVSGAGWPGRRSVASPRSGTD
jgi:hypothetical protein